MRPNILSVDRELPEGNVPSNQFRLSVELQLVAFGRGNHQGDAVPVG
jgi:hypothetical protein